ncbi:hypothetical protein BGZ95_003612 [Linnemannia exigua]|uniref:F-box domain-containing protein n=1 Tax=Linnemannia exigua TaxID=604196 RepID=A0AAD4H2A8_9FUNG|nr:hypothetical protein BGZ95_003612 [Linnemannia exigua]
MMQVTPQRFIPDVALLIAKHLTKRDLAHCCRVSHAWRDIWAESLWSQFYEPKFRRWYILELPLDTLRHVGRYIRKLDLRRLEYINDDDDPIRIYGNIFRACPHVSHLDVSGGVLCGQSIYSWLTTGEAEGEGGGKDRGIEGTQEKRANNNAKMGRLFRNAPPLTLFSNSLVTLKFTGDYTCELMMHWIGLAARTGSRLQNLETVAMCADRHTARYRTKGYPLRLSFLLLFLRSIPRLKNLALEGCDIFDDTPPDAVVDAVFPPAPKAFIRRSAAAEPKSSTSSSSRRFFALETLKVQEFDSPSVMAKLLRHLPAISLLQMSYLDGRDYLAALRLFYCGQNLRLTITRNVASNITESDWTEFFEDDGYNQSSLNSTLSLPGESITDGTTTTTITPTAWRRLFLDFKRSHIHGFTNSIAKVIAQSPISSHQVTGLMINEASNLSKVGVHAILYNCPNLEVLSLSSVPIMGDIFEDPTPWACRSTLFNLSLSELNMSAFGGQAYAAAARHHIRQLPELQCLELRGHWILSDMVIDHSSDMGRGERLYTEAGKQDVMAWPKLNYFSLDSPKRYITLPEFKVLLSLFPFHTNVELWAWVETPAENWIRENRPDMEYILHACDYYG